MLCTQHYRRRNRIVDSKNNNKNIKLPSVSRRLKRFVRPLLWRFPSLHSIVMRVLYGSWPRRLYGDFWVAGFPRSGNTFAGVLLAETGEFGRVGYHFHMAGDIVALSQSDIPGIMVLRRPDDAAISWAILNDWTKLECALEDYIDFHEFLLPRVESLNVACFDWFTKHPQELICAVAATLGSECRNFDLSEELLKRVNTKIEHTWLDDQGFVDEQKVARPSHARIEKKNNMLEELHSSPHLVSLLAEAMELYGRFHSRSKEFSARSNAIAGLTTPVRL